MLLLPSNLLTTSGLHRKWKLRLLSNWDSLRGPWRQCHQLRQVVHQPQHCPDGLQNLLLHLLSWDHLAKVFSIIESKPLKIWNFFKTFLLNFLLCFYAKIPPISYCMFLICFICLHLVSGRRGSTSSDKKRSKSRARSKSPFRSFRWPKSKSRPEPGAAGSYSDDEDNVSPRSTLRKYTTSLCWDLELVPQSA